MSLKNKIFEMYSNKDINGWSDLHIQEGQSFSFRDKNGELLSMDIHITRNLISDLFLFNFPQYNSIEELMEENNGDVDFSIAFEKEDEVFSPRFRGNLYFFQGHKIGAVLRKINESAINIEDLNLPPLARTFNKRGSGLLLVTGATGSGKTTTLAAMIDELNHSVNGKIITLEDPVEYIFKDEKCSISQREIGKGKDSISFATGLKAALRQDPDIILVGEIRDQETANICLEAAQTGHLVMGTLHTKDAAGTVSRFIQMFSSSDKEKARSVFSDVLIGVISQTLVPKISGGKAMACEVMIANSAIKGHISKGRDNQIHNEISTGTNETKMQTMNMSLMDMVSKNIIEPITAVDYSSSSEEMKNTLKKEGYNIKENDYTDKISNQKQEKPKEEKLKDKKVKKEDEDKKQNIFGNFL